MPLPPYLAPQWTPEEIARLGELYPDHSNEEIAAIMGRTPASVKVRAVWNGFRKSPAYKYRVKSGPRPRKQVGCIPNPLPVIERLLRKHGYNSKQRTDGVTPPVFRFTVRKPKPRKNPIFYPRAQIAIPFSENVFQKLPKNAGPKI